MREAVDTARAIITATAEGMAIGDLRLADNLVQQIEAELAALDDRAAAAHRAGNIIHRAGGVGEADVAPDQRGHLPCSPRCVRGAVAQRDL